MLKKKIIQYFADDEIIPDLQPVKKFVPQWYKDSERFVGGKQFLQTGVEGNALKLCVPFLDALTLGYAVCLHCDILVEQTEFGPMLKWRGQLPPVVERSKESAKTLPVPGGHSEEHFAWIGYTAFKLPKGYSLLWTHPLNRFDLPFTTISGVMDSDSAAEHGGNFPVFFKKDFEGVISRGTPIAQVIPFKRDNWIKEKNPKLLEEAKLNFKLSTTVLYGWYKDNVWKRKNFE
jgi:hypothetical protein